MKTQRDYPVRVVALTNLNAMCAHISGMCHSFKVVRIGQYRVNVVYSNPDEYGTNHPMEAVFPSYPSGDKDNPCIVLDILRVVHDSWHGDGWQAFQPLLDCPVLWRDPATGKWAPTKVTVVCSICHKEIDAMTAHSHQNEWIGNDCCWDERLKASE